MRARTEKRTNKMGQQIIVRIMIAITITFIILGAFIVPFIFHKLTKFAESSFQTATTGLSNRMENLDVSKFLNGDTRDKLVYNFSRQR